MRLCARNSPVLGRRRDLNAVGGRVNYFVDNIAPIYTYNLIYYVLRTFVVIVIIVIIFFFFNRIIFKKNLHYVL